MVPLLPPHRRFALAETINHDKAALMAQTLGINLEHSTRSRRGVRAPEWRFVRGGHRLAAYWPQSGLVMLNGINHRATSLIDATDVVCTAVVTGRA